MTTGQPLPIHEAAQALGLSPGQLRRLVAAGAPCARHGQRGRGHVALIDPQAVRVWSGANARDALVMELSGVLPAILADALSRAHQLTDGPHKRAVAGSLVGTWILANGSLMDHLRDRCPSVPEASNELPEQVERLKKIFMGQ